MEGEAEAPAAGPPGGRRPRLSAEQRKMRAERVERAVQDVLAEEPTLGMKAVYAAVKDSWTDSADIPSAKEVRRALAAQKRKAPRRPNTASNERGAPSGPICPALDSFEEESVPATKCIDYSNFRVPPASLASPPGGGCGPATQFLALARTFVERHRQLLEMQAFDVYFLVDNMWERLVPKDWRVPLQTASASTLGALAQGRVPRGWPKSLHDFVQQAQAAQLDPLPQFAQTQNAAATKCMSSNQVRRHWFGTSAKKREEIEQMACRIAQEVAATTGSLQTSAEDSNRRTVVVDVGSGKGYLSTLLALDYGVRVLAVESDAGNSVAAASRLNRITRQSESYDQCMQPREPNSTNGPQFMTAKIIAERERQPANEPEQIGQQQQPRRRQDSVSFAAAATAAKEERSKQMRLQYGPGHNGARQGAALHSSSVLEANGTLSVPVSQEVLLSSCSKSKSIGMLLADAGFSSCPAILVGLHACGTMTVAIRVFRITGSDYCALVIR